MHRRQHGTSVPAQYEYNPGCPCEVCKNSGEPPSGPSSGHSYAYGEPHIPPSQAPAYVAQSAFIGPGVTIGARAVIGPGAVIGWQGFGYSPDPDGGWKRKPETHGVVIGRDVHIGANTCIDRGSYRDTIIGSGTKIDNLVHIAHNVRIGEDCLVIAGAEVSGSVVIGDGSWIGPNACIKEHVTIGANVMVGIGTVVIRDVPDNTTVVGNPARVLTSEVGVRERS